MVAAALDFVRKTEGKSDSLVLWCFAGVFLTMPMGISPALLFAGLAVLIWAFSGMALRVQSFFTQSWLWPVLAFIALSWVGLLYTPDFRGFGINYAGKTYYWIFCLTLASVSLEKLRPRWLINTFLLGLALNSCVGMLQFAGLIAPKFGWFSGLTRGYNTLTVYLVLAILICAFYFRETEQVRKRAGLAGLMLFYFFHLIIMQGRTGYLTFVVLFPLLIRTIFRKVSVWKLAGAFTLIIGMMSFSPIVRDRIELTARQLRYHMNAEPEKAWGREYTVHQDRFYMWMGAIEIFLENPIIGVGTGGYPEALKQKRSPNDPLIAHPHNNILHVAASYGTIGIVAFFWLFGEILRNGWKHRHTVIGHFILCTGLVLFVNGLFNTTVLDAGTLLLLSLVMGLHRALPQFSRALEPEHPAST